MPKFYYPTAKAWVKTIYDAWLRDAEMIGLRQAEENRDD